jgi:hypothetical protein
MFPDFTPDDTARVFGHHANNPAVLEWLASLPPRLREAIRRYIIFPPKEFDPDKWRKAAIAVARVNAHGKRAARDELRPGHRAAAAVETVNDDAWQRAQFLALREELSAEWQPRNGVGRQLIDTMAQAQQGFLHWLRTLTIRTTLESCTNDRRHKEEGRWGPPRQSDADALDQAAAMMDRYNPIILRTLRALCDMRRHSGAVIVKKGGQVNVAQQQVNVGT